MKVLVGLKVPSSYYSFYIYVGWVYDRLGKLGDGGSGVRLG
jgi:hypothetical protein